MKNKICNTCGISKSLEEYSKRGASPDGYQQKCKNCNKVDNAKYRQTYPLYKKEWDTKNPGVQSQIVKDWVKNNPDKFKNNLKKYHTKLGCGVYRINNLLENKSYIGSSAYLLPRLFQHFNKNHKGASNQNMQDDMRRLGHQWFSFEILEHCKPEDLRVKEQFWIDTLKPIYNDANAVKK